MELSNTEVYTNEQTNDAVEATQIDRWERILEAEGLSPLEQDGLYLDENTLYLGIGGATREGIDLPGEADVERPGEEEEGEEEITTPVGESRPVLLPEDFAVLSRLREHGHAATLDGAEASPESIVRLAGAGFAHGRIPEEGDVVVFAMAGATDRDVWRAVNHARCDALEAGFLADVAECEQIAGAVISRIEKLGGACGEGALVESLLADHPREAIKSTLAELGRRGLLRRLASRATGTSLLAAPATDNQTLVEKLQALLRLEHRAEANRRLRAKTFVAAASGSRPDDDVPADPFAAEKAFASFLRAMKGGSLAVAESKAEARGIEANRKRMRAGYIERRGSGRKLVVTPAAELDTRYDRLRARHARRSNFWGSISREARANPEKVALDTARAVLRGLGVEPDALGRDDRRRALLAVLASEGSGIGTSGRLAAAVAGFRAASARAKTTASAPANASARAPEMSRPVAA